MPKLLPVSAALLLAAACTLNRPSTGPGRTSPMMTTVTATPRDSLFARAFAAMRERGYTEITPDTAAHQVRGKSPKGTSVIVALDAAAGDSTRVTVSAAGDRRSIGIDAEAMATMMTLMADVTRPPGAMVDSPVRPVRPSEPDSTTRKP